MATAYPIRILRSRIPPADLALFVGKPFPGMVKFVADVDRRVLAIGGELHADAEELLLDGESKQDSLWGGNYYPGRGEDGCIEYNSMINIRPARGNASMDVQDPGVRGRMRELVFAFLGRGEPLP